MDGLVQKRCNFIANTLELRHSCTNLSKWWWKRLYSYLMYSLYVLLMTSESITQCIRWPDNCDSSTWKVIFNPFDIDFILGHFMADHLRKWVVITSMQCSFAHLIIALLWRHNGHDGLTNHQPHDCLLNHLFRHRSKKTPKLRVTGLCAGNSLVTGEFPAQMASNAEKVSIWWHHYEKGYKFP